MTPYFFDSETYPIQPGLLAPPVVCLQDEGGIRTGAAIRDAWETALRSGRLIVAHSAAYDTAVLATAFPDLLEEILLAYEEDRIVDTKVREALLLIALGRAFGQSYSLAECCKRHGIDHGYNVNADGKKAEAWRVRYAELEGVPVDQWPADAVRYAELDVSNLRALYEAQAARAPESWYADQFRQTRADFWLHLATCWGMKTDPEAVEEFTRKIEAEHVEVGGRLKSAGLVRATGVKNQAAAQEHMATTRLGLGLPIRLTEGGEKAHPKGLAVGVRPDDPKHTGLAAKLCQETGDPLLIDYARYTSIAALRSRAWRMAAGYDTPIQPRFNVLMETGRTSCSKGEKSGPTNGDQVQNVHREPGVRECYIPRPGRWFLSVDWSSAEMHTFAQAMAWQQGQLGDLGKALNAGKDPHSVLGAALAGQTYEDFRADLKGSDPERRARAKGFRQMAKAGNFGFPGGMGIPSFREYAAASYGVILSEEEARELKTAWFSRAPEARQYFKDVDATLEINGGITHHRSDRLRGRVAYCAACNSYFQGLAADMAKAAGWRIMRECYTGAGPLRGSRIVNFIHDEFLLEVPADVDLANAAALRTVEIMEDAGREWCPDVPVRAEPALMERWIKAAEPAYDAAGRLVPWSR